MIKLISFFSIALVVFLYSCSGSDTSKTVSLKKGSYVYIISDSSGKSLVEGMLMINSVKKQMQRADYSVTGSYTISEMTGDSSYTGFSSMRDGDFKGYYNDSLKFININTNPKIADANVFINAYVKGNDMQGGWSFSTLRGTHKEGGIFAASKVK